MVPRIRLVAAAGGILAALSLTGCAPKGTDNGYGAADQPALANATGEPSPQPSAVPTTPAAAPVQVTEELKAVTIARMGSVVTDEKGWVLYRFDKDTANPSKSACEGTCAQIWPPSLTDGNPKLTGIDPTKVGTVIRSDGTSQLTLGGWPLYRYIGDTKPGQWKGQNVSGTWFVVAPTGKKNLTCLPTPPPTPVAPPSASASADGGGGGGY